jgi:hypothetical protein
MRQLLEYGIKLGATQGETMNSEELMKMAGVSGFLATPTLSVDMSPCSGWLLSSKLCNPDIIPIQFSFHFASTLSNTPFFNLTHDTFLYLIHVLSFS